MIKLFKNLGVAFVVLITILVIVYYLGPRVKLERPTHELPVLDIPINKLQSYIANKESNYSIKPNNESVIVWADTVDKPTEYVLLYLHGFSASRYEGYPLTQNFIDKFGTNAYLPRLAGHGLQDRDGMLAMTPKNLYDSAKEALVISTKLGKKIVIMATSTGCTLALMLAADYPELVDGLILYSPNVEIKQKAAKLLSGHWGKLIARIAFGGAYRYTADYGTASDKYWSSVYPIEALIYLQQLLDVSMNAKEFSKVKAPLFLGLYYKNENEQDQTIEVKAALKMFDEVGTPTALKEKVLFPNAGDHVIACEFYSESIPEVRKETFSFVERILKISPKP